MLWSSEQEKAGVAPREGAGDLGRLEKIIAFSQGDWFQFSMPLVFEKEGFRFVFYSNDHRPIHVHVRKGDGEAIFNVEDLIELRESSGMKVRDLARAQELAEENKQIIIQKWHEHLG